MFSRLRIRTGIAVIVVVASAACTLMPRLLTYRHGNVTAYGERAAGVGTKSAYYRLEIGTPEQPFRRTPSLILRLADGSFLRTDQIDVAALRARAQRITRNPRLWIDQGGWPTGIEEIAVDGYRFLVRDDAVVAVFLATRWDIHDVTPPPAVADVERKEFHQLPLDQKTLIEMFGKYDTLNEGLADPL
jgi:hypothetical protein